MTLAEFWFAVIVVVWTGFLVLEGFDFGVGALHRAVGRDEADRDLAIRTIGPFWDGNEVWLIVAVAGTFAAFPAWYATALSAFYPLYLVVLVALILRGVSFEFRDHARTERARQVWSVALTAGSVVAPLGLGIVLGGYLGGVPIDAQEEFVGGLGDLFRPYAVLTGVAVTAVCLLHGAVFLALRTTGSVHRRALRLATVLGPLTAVVVFAWVVSTRVDTGGVLLSVVELGTVLVAIAAAVLVHLRQEGAAFVATAATAAGLVVSLFSELYPRVLVSSLGPDTDLTLAATASSSYALWVMTVVLAVFLPVVLVYQGWTYHVFRRRLSRTSEPDAPAPSVPGSG
jgi:cytochrome d ubiquinol oxidase subunit II